MTSVATILEAMQGRFNANAAAGMDVVFQFNLEDGENHYVAVKNGASQIFLGQAANPDVTLSMDASTLSGITTGKTDGLQAFMAGKLRAEGDMALALKLTELFPA